MASNPAEGDELLQTAQNHYVNGQFTEAIKTAERARDRGASASRAWRIIGSSACNIPDLRLAQEAYRRGDGQARQFMVYVCQKQGIAYTGTRFEKVDGT